jgi:hypothetical protein
MLVFAMRTTVTVAASADGKAKLRPKLRGLDRDRTPKAADMRKRNARVIHDARGVILIWEGLLKNQSQ